MHRGTFRRASGPAPAPGPRWRARTRLRAAAAPVTPTRRPVRLPRGRCLSASRAKLPQDCQSWWRRSARTGASVAASGLDRPSSTGFATVAPVDVSLTQLLRARLVAVSPISIMNGISMIRNCRERSRIGRDNSVPTCSETRRPSGTADRWRQPSARTPQETGGDGAVLLLLHCRFVQLRRANVSLRWYQCDCSESCTAASR